MTLFLLGLLLTAPAVASTNTFVRATTAPVTLEAVLTQFKKYDRELLSVKTRFSQSLQMTGAPIRQSVEGTIVFAKPYRFRIEHLKPARQSVVSDGKDVWVHRHDRNQVVQAKLDDWRNADPTIDHLLRFGRYAQLLKTYAVELDTSTTETTLILTPKKESEGEFTLRLTLAPRTLFPRMADMTVGGVTMRTLFEDTEFNAETDPKLFNFKPPPDADVFLDFKPPKFTP